MRFFLVVVVLALAALIGLFIYGDMLQPNAHVIEQEALSAEGA